MNEKLKSSALSQELEQLFDLKHAKSRHEKQLVLEANEAQRDIRLLSLMFRDGIPDMTMPVSDHESIRWDSRTQQLIYINKNVSHILEGAARQIMIRMRPHLTQLVKQAKEFYRD